MGKRRGGPILSFRFRNREEIRAVKRLAKAEGLNQTNLIRKRLGLPLNEEGPRKRRKAGAAAVGAAVASTEDRND